MGIEVVRFRPHTSGKYSGQTESYRPYRNRNGKFLLGDPKYGGDKKLKKNQVAVDEIEEAVDKIENQGFSLRMKGDLTGQQNLIRPADIKITRT